MQRILFVGSDFFIRMAIEDEHSWGRSVSEPKLRDVPIFEAAKVFQEIT